MMEIDIKSCFSIEKIISTRKRRAEHPFSGWNTKHPRLLVWRLVTSFMYGPLFEISSNDNIILLYSRKPLFILFTSEWAHSKICSNFWNILIFRLSRNSTHIRRFPNVQRPETSLGLTYDILFKIDLKDSILVPASCLNPMPLSKLDLT